MQSKETGSLFQREEQLYHIHFTCTVVLQECSISKLCQLKLCKYVLQVLNEKKLQEVDSLWKEFETPEKANKM